MPDTTTTPPAELPRVELERAYHRLLGVFGPPAKMQQDGWLWALQAGTRGWSEFELRIATQQAAASCRFFPRPADLIAHRPLRRPDQRSATPSGAGPDVCRSCGVHWYYAGYRTPSGVVSPRLRCDCPRASAGWEHPDALAWRETDVDLVGAGYSRRRSDVVGSIR